MTHDLLTRPAVAVAVAYRESSYYRFSCVSVYVLFCARFLFELDVLASVLCVRGLEIRFFVSVV